MDVKYCHTEEMWDTVLNKPKQGNKFRYFRADLTKLGINYDNDINKNDTSGRNEVVEVEIKPRIYHIEKKSEQGLGRGS